MTDEERRKAYQAEAGPILDEYFQKLEECAERHKNDDSPHGLDDGPGTEEWNAINREMLGKLRELRRKYAPSSDHRNRTSY